MPWLRIGWIWVGLALLALATIGGYVRIGSDRTELFHNTIQILIRDNAIPPDVIREFEQRANVRVHVTYFDSNYSLLALLSDPKTHFDVVMPSSFMAHHLMDDKLLARFDPRKIPNLENMDREAFPMAFDPTNSFVIPYQWGSVGIGYDSDTVTGLPKSWSDLLRHVDPTKSKSRIVLIDDGRYVLGSALIYLGFSPNTENLSEIDRAGALLKSISDSIAYVDMDNAVPLLESGKVSMAMIWGPALAKAMRDKKSLRISLPREGSIIFRFCLAMPKAADNKEAAQQFLDFLLRPEIAARVTNASFFPTTVRGASPFVDRFVLNGPAYFRNPAGKNYVIDHVGPAAGREYIRVWEDFATRFRPTDTRHRQQHHHFDEDPEPLPP